MSAGSSGSSAKESPDAKRRLAQAAGRRQTRPAASAVTAGDRKVARLDRALRVKTLPISLALPWGVDVGDFASHLPLPAKITIEVLEPIDLRERFGADPDHDQVYQYVTGVMQEKLSELQSERRLPPIG